MSATWYCRAIQQLEQSNYCYFISPVAMLLKSIKWQGRGEGYNCNVVRLDAFREISGNKQLNYSMGQIKAKRNRYFIFPFDYVTTILLSLNQIQLLIIYPVTMKRFVCVICEIYFSRYRTNAAVFKVLLKNSKSNYIDAVRQVNANNVLFCSVD